MRIDVSRPSERASISFRPAVAREREPGPRATQRRALDAPACGSWGLAPLARDTPLRCAVLAVSAFAQSFPSHPLRMIVPAPPAGITDLSARLVGEGLRAKFGQPVVIENKSGANGLIGLRELLKAEPDGYTLMAGTMGNFVLGYAMEVNAPFDALRDLAPIAGTAEYATAMIVNPKMPVNSVREFIDYAKARPGKLTFGSTGTAALDYLAVELFMKQTGTKLVHVPYRGGPAALNDLMGGSIDVLIEVFPVVMEQIKTGAVKGLAVSSPLSAAGYSAGADLRGGGGERCRADRMARRLRASANARRYSRDARRRHRGDRQAARHNREISRHRLRTDRARHAGVFQLSRCRSEALGCVHDRSRI
ncbi:MAG: tripartite tricarboxylate transporter substrate binding protein, partial [Alphaproteobacteria bacterium]